MTSDNDTTKFPNDLGHFPKPLSKEDRHFLVSSPPFQPTVNNMPGKHFPRKIYSGHYRSFQSSWFMKTLESGEKVPRLWLTYSLVKHAMMCLPCFLFASETSGVSGKYRYSKEWSEDGVSNWKKGLEKLCEHEKSESHQICSEKLENLQCGVPIDEVIDRQRALATQKSHEKILRNKAILSRVIELVELFARQNISFRGHREDSESLNRGNFIEFLHHQARYDPLLNEHLFSGARNA